MASCRQMFYLQLWLSRNPKSCSSKPLAFVHMKQGFVPPHNKQPGRNSRRVLLPSSVFTGVPVTVLLWRTRFPRRQSPTHPELWSYFCSLMGGENVHLSWWLTAKRRRNNARGLFFSYCCSVHCILFCFNIFVLFKFSFSIESDTLTCV